MNTPWYRMYLYSKLKKGPTSLFLPKGYVLSFIPKIFEVNKKKVIN